MHPTDEEREKGVVELIEKMGMERRKAERLYDMGIKSFDGLLSVTLTTLEKLVDDTQPEKKNEYVKIHDADKIKEEEAYFECPLCGTRVGEFDKECSNCKAHFAQGEIEDVQYVCPSCGSPVNDDATKCSKCNKKFEE